MIDFGPRCACRHPETGDQCVYVPDGHTALGGSHKGSDGSRWLAGWPLGDGKFAIVVQDPDGTTRYVPDD